MSCITFDSHQDLKSMKSKISGFHDRESWYLRNREDLSSSKTIILCENIQDKSWLKLLFNTSAVMENLFHQVNYFSAVLLYLKSLFHTSPKFTISAGFMPLEHHKIHSYFYIYIFKYQKRFEFWLCHNILCPRQGYLTFLNFSLFIGKVVIVLFALLAHWEIEM